MTKTTVKCPKCNTSIDIEELMKTQLEAKLLEENKAKLQEELDKLNLSKEEILKERAALDKYKKEEKETFERKIAEERKKIIAEEELKMKESTTKVLQEQNQKMKLLSEQNFKLQQSELELKTKEQQLKQQYDLQLKQQLFDEKSKMSESIRKEEHDKFQLEKIQLEKKMGDQMKLLDEMQRKANQGSMQLQGEALEMFVEDSIKKTFPFDTLIEVQKGQKGADWIHQIIHKEKQIGSIIIECKNTQSFAGDWIEKLKMNQKESKADIAILITKTYPKNVTNFTWMDDVWVCSLDEFIGLTAALRMQLVKISELEKTQQNKGDKSIQMYDFLTSDGFRSSIEAVIKSYQSLRAEIEKEKRFFEKNWKLRELNLTKMISNTTEIYTNIQSIGGTETLSLPYFDEEPSNDIWDQMEEN